MNTSKKGEKLAEILGFAALALGLLTMAAPASALNLQLDYPEIPGAEKTLNQIVEDQLVERAGTDCKVECKEVGGKLLPGKLKPGEAGVAKTCKLIPAQFTIPDIFVFLF